jgi:hypothetical protein
MAAPRTRDAILSAYFGSMAVSIWKLLPSIDAKASRQNYTFMDMDVFNGLIRQNPERAQAIYWREMTLRIHLACCASLLRHADWLSKIVRLE